MKAFFLVLWRVFLLIFGLYSVVGGGFCVAFGLAEGSSGAWMALIGGISLVIGVSVFVATVRALKRRPSPAGDDQANAGKEQP